MNRRLIHVAAVVLSLLLVPCARAAYSPATTNGWFITSGHVLGLGNALFQTDIWLFNPDASADVTVTLIFHPAVVSGQPAATPVVSAPIVVAARETRFFA